LITTSPVNDSIQLFSLLCNEKDCLFFYSNALKLDSVENVGSIVVDVSAFIVLSLIWYWNNEYVYISIDKRIVYVYTGPQIPGLNEMAFTKNGGK